MGHNNALPQPFAQWKQHGFSARLDELLQRLQVGEFDLVAVGRAPIANPDGVELVRPDSLATMKAFRKEDLATLA